MSAATIPSFDVQAPHRRDGEILKDDAEGEGEDIIDNPDCEDFVAKEAMPAERDGDRRNGEHEPFRHDVAERAAAAAMERAVPDLDRERGLAVRRILMPLHGGVHLLLARGAPVGEILPDDPDRAEQRRDRPYDIHDPHVLGMAEKVDRDNGG